MTSSQDCSRLGFILRGAFRVWPPLEVWWTNREIARNAQTISDQVYPQIYAQYLEQLSEARNAEIISREVDEIVDAEQRRRETIDARASSLLFAVGIVIPLTLLVPQITGAAPGAHASSILLLGAVVAVALVHFAAAVYHSVQSSRIGALYLLSANSIESIIHSTQYEVGSAIAAQKLAFIKMNEPRLTIKTNHLIGAQEMFRRGIILLAIAAIASIFVYAVAA